VPARGDYADLIANLLFAAAGAWVKLDGLPSVLLIGAVLGLLYPQFMLRRAPRGNHDCITIAGLSTAQLHQLHAERRAPLLGPAPKSG
jgi:hypothetical protein